MGIDIDDGETKKVAFSSRPILDLSGMFSRPSGTWRLCVGNTLNFYVFDES